jgi:hypothetical protein
MKKRVKNKRVNVSPVKINKSKNHSLPVVLFSIVIFFIVYAGLMSILDTLISSSASPGINANAVSDTGALASYYYSPGTIIFAFGLIFILFIVFLVFIYKIKLKKKIFLKKKRK